MKYVIAVIAILCVCIDFALATPVNVNTAKEDELETLHGITAAKAMAIIDYREKHGHFKSVDELRKVPGLSTASVNNIRKDVTLTGNTKTSTDILSDDKAAGRRKHTN